MSQDAAGAMHMQRTDWASKQIARVQKPVYDAKRVKVARAKRRAKYDGHVEYRLSRRIMRQDGRIWAVSIRNNFDF